MKTNKQKKHELLLRFADFLHGQTEPQEREIATFEMGHGTNDDNKKTSLTCLFWVFTFLPDVFYEGPNDWYIDSFNGEILYGPAEDPDKGDTISCVFSFFKLEGISEFRYLFCTGDKIHEQSTCKEVAENIIQWVKENKET